MKSNNWKKGNSDDISHFLNDSASLRCLVLDEHLKEGLGFTPIFFLAFPAQICIPLSLAIHFTA
jgi:hypothetical protein